MEGHDGPGIDSSASSPTSGGPIIRQPPGSRWISRRWPRSELPCSARSRALPRRTYVLAADVYTNPHGSAAAAGTWYTGAAAWTWRLANLIPIFELTMLGAVLATVVTLLVSARLPRRLPALYDPEVSDGEILVGVAHPSERALPDLERALRIGGETTELRGLPYDLYFLAADSAVEVHTIKPSMEIPTIDDVREAARRINKNGVHRTPVLTSSTLDAMTGANLFFKCENFQKIGAFKFRGASNAILSLSEDEARRGVVTMSSGNHAAAVALAARLRGIPAYIAMPETAPAAKQRAVEGYGGEITLKGRNINEVDETARRIQEETRAIMIHPFDDPRVIAGQSTAALEFLEDYPDLDAIIGPVSGGGLMSGTCIAASALKPAIRLFGAEPLNADDASRSLRAGQRLTDGPRNTIADGLRASLSERTFTILSRHLREILTVTEEQIIAATREIWQRMKIIVEPSGAVSFAAVAAYPDRFAGKRVGVIVSGGNLDLDRLPWQLQNL